MEHPKHVRFAEFLRRLAALPPAASAEEAWRQIEVVMNQVEDEMTFIPFNPDRWAVDGRLYPPQADSKYSVPGHPRVIALRSRRHVTYISDNGALEIRSVEKDRESVVLTRPGADGREVWA